MTYHKRSPIVRKCAHCRTKFESNHKSRLYCCNSCNTLACRARRGPAAGASLDFSAQTIAVVALGSTVGSLVAQGGAYLAQKFTQGGSDLELLRADVRQLRQGLSLAPARPPAGPGADFLPAALRSATAPVVQLSIEDRLVPFVRLAYHGHVLYHHRAQGMVLWEERPGRHHRVSSEAQLSQLAAHPLILAAPAASVFLPPGEDLFEAQSLTDMHQIAVQESAASAIMDRFLQQAMAPGSEPSADSPPA